MGECREVGRGRRGRRRWRELDRGAGRRGWKRRRQINDGGRDSGSEGGDVRSCDRTMPSKRPSGRMGGHHGWSGTQRGGGGPGRRNGEDLRGARSGCRDSSSGGGGRAARAEGPGGLAGAGGGDRMGVSL